MREAQRFAWRKRETGFVVWIYRIVRKKAWVAESGFAEPLRMKHT